MQVVEDESGVLYLQTTRTGLAIYSLQTALAARG